MKKLLGTVAIISTLALAGCGDIAEVRSGYVAKLSTASGLQEDIIPPSKIRLSNWCVTCDSLILAEASDSSFKEEMQIFMPRDQLNISVDARAIVSISSDLENVNKLFARIAPEPLTERVSVIPMVKTYEIYAGPIIREVVRTELSKHTIMEVMTNRESISADISAKISARLKNTPVAVVNFGLADIQPPDVIVRAQETRKEREIEIERADAEKLVALKRAEAALEVARKQQEVDLVEAETQALVEKVLADAVSPAFVTQRALRVLEQMAENDNKVFFLPQEAFSKPEMILGAMVNRQ